MVNHNFSGTEMFVLIKPNTECITFGVTRDGSAIDHPVIMNGLIMVSSTFAAPYTSFATLLAADPNFIALVLNMDSGELRWYDGNQTLVTDFIDPRYDSVGFVKGGDYSINRSAENIVEAGNPEVADIKQGTTTYDINIEKMFSGRWKTAYAGDPEAPAAVTDATKILNPLGFTGIEAFLDLYNPASAAAKDEGESGHTPWFLVIFYSRDASDATTRRGQTVAFMCCRAGDSMNPKFTADGTYVEGIKFKGMRMVHAPRDDYQTYTKTFVDPQ